MTAHSWWLSVGLMLQAGYVAQQLVDRLDPSAFKTVYIHIDSWLNPPVIRFSADNKAIHFYNQGLRLDDLFRSVIDL